MAQQPTPLALPRVARNVAALGGANVGRILVAFALQVLVARFLGPSGLGNYAVAQALLHVAQITSEAGQPARRVRDMAQWPRRRRALFTHTVVIQFAFACLAWALLALVAQALPINAELRRALIVVGATLPSYAFYSASETLFEAAERMELEFVVEVTTNALLLAATAWALWRGGGLVAVMAAAVGVQAASVVLCAWLVRRRRSLLFPAPQEAAALRYSASVREAMPYYGIALADVAQQRADVLLLGLLAGPSLTGIYAGASSVVRVLTKLAQSYWRALYPTLSRLYGGGDPAFERLRRGALLAALGASSVAAALGSLLAAPLLPRVFGADFAASAPVFAILVWVAPAYVTSLYAVYLLLTAHRPRRALAVTLANLGLTVVLLPPLAARWGAPGAAAAVVLAGAATAGTGLALLGAALRRRGQAR